MKSPLRGTQQKLLPFQFVAIPNLERSGLFTLAACAVN